MPALVLLCYISLREFCKHSGRQSPAFIGVGGKIRVWNGLVQKPWMTQSFPAPFLWLLLLLSFQSLTLQPAASTLILFFLTSHFPSLLPPSVAFLIIFLSFIAIPAAFSSHIFILTSTRLTSKQLTHPLASSAVWKVPSFRPPHFSAPRAHAVPFLLPSPPLEHKFLPFRKLSFSELLQRCPWPPSLFSCLYTTHDSSIACRPPARPPVAQSQLTSPAISSISNPTDHFCRWALPVRVLSHPWLTTFLCSHHTICRQICPSSFHWASCVLSLRWVSPPATLFQSSGLQMAHAWISAGNDDLPSSIPSEYILFPLCCSHPPYCFRPLLKFCVTAVWKRPMGRSDLSVQVWILLPSSSLLIFRLRIKLDVLRRRL